MLQAAAAGIRSGWQATLKNNGCSLLRQFTTLVSVRLIGVNIAIWIH
jgi:hypothetical protein